MATNRAIKSLITMEEQGDTSKLFVKHESELGHGIHFSVSSLAPSTLSTSVMVSSPGITEPRPFNNLEDGSPPMPLLKRELFSMDNRELDIELFNEQSK